MLSLPYSRTDLDVLFFYLFFITLYQAYNPTINATYCMSCMRKYKTDMVQEKKRQRKSRYTDL